MPRETKIARAAQVALELLDDARQRLSGAGAVDALYGVAGAIDHLRAAVAREREAQVTHSEEIERFCRLRELVAEHVLHHNVPNDCICGTGGYCGPDGSSLSTFRNSGKALAFIEQAVRDALTVAVARQAGRAVRTKLQEAHTEAARFNAELRRLTAARRQTS